MSVGGGSDGSVVGKWSGGAAAVMVEIVAVVFVGTGICCRNRIGV